MKNTLSASQKDKASLNPNFFSKMRNGSENDRLRRWYLFFSIIWIASVSAYGFGNWREMRMIGGHLSYIEVLALIAILFVPLIVIWTPIWLATGVDDTQTRHQIQSMPNGQLPAILDNQTRYRLPPEVHEKLEKIDSKLRDITDKMNILNNNQSLVNSNILATLPLMKEHLVATSGNARASGAVHFQGVEAKPSADLHAPALPLTENGANAQLSLADLALVLDFSDRTHKGDWANAFWVVQSKNQYLDLVRMAEAVIETLEQEGIYVEDLALRQAEPIIWRRFARGERDDMTPLIAGIQDPTVLALMRLRIRNDHEFQDLSLRFQKRFMDVLGALEAQSMDQDIDYLADSRTGRAFVILGQISGVLNAPNH